MDTRDESLFLAHLASANPQVYNLVVQCCAHGEVDARRWADAIECIFAWHGLHERRFASDFDGIPKSGVDASRNCAVVVHECPDAESAATLARALVDAEKDVVFDIGREVLFRNTLVVAPDRAYWVLNIHHAIADGWSISLLIDQIERCYTHGELPGALPSSHVASNARDLVFWQDAFATARRNLEHTAERPRSPRATRHMFRYTRQESDRIYAYCRRHGFSLNDFFTAVLASYLFHAHSLSRSSFEVSLHGRSTIADKGSAGKFVKFVPLNIELSPDLDFAAQCALVRSRNRQLLRHHRFPVHASTSRAQGLVRPDMPFAINYQNSKHTNRFAGHRFDVDWIFTGYDEHWLTLNVNDFQDEEITLSVDLNDSVYGPEYQSLILQRLVDIAGTVLDDNPVVGQISPLCDADRAVLDRQCSKVTRSTEGVFHLDWLAKPPRAPLANAILTEAATLSHAEFRSRIGDCRDAFRQAGGRAGDRVAICLDNGWPALAWVYAIWLESGVYVPIDHDTPRGRVDALVASACVRFLVSDRMELQDIEACRRLPVLPLPSSVARIDTHVDCSVDPDSTAYILYTSGSTGKPKGVMVPHRAISEYAAQFVAYFDLSDADTVLQQASLAFDASFEEFVPVLAIGGAVVPWNRYRLLEPAGLLPVLRHFDVSVVSLSPVVMGELNRQFDDLPRLRVAISGGDVLEWTQCDRLLARGVAVYNTYGPTEATICATYKQVDGARITLGLPIRNTNVFVLNEHGARVGIGVPGQLAIAGVGVAQGYLDDPQATALQFRHNPFATSPHDATLYLTGDRAMLDSSGELVFLGRSDDQVSINGYRVELREVEAGIATCPGVENRAVWFDAASGRLMACYSGQVDIETVKAHLGAHLPKHMMPHGWHRLDAMPLTQSGKLDMRRLRELCAEQAIASGTVGVVLSGFASRIAALWREVLQRDVDVTLDSDFFALGGTSLKLLELLRLYADRVNALCALRPLLQDSTLQSHVALLESVQSQSMPAFARFPPAERWPATPQQRAMIVEERASGITGLYNVPAVLRWTGRLDRRRFALSLDILRKRHALLQCEWQVEGMFVRASERLADLTFESATDIDSPEAWLTSSVLASWIAVDLLRAGRLLWKVGVFEHDAECHTVVFLFHHALVDAWTLRMLDQEFQDIYSGLDIDGDERACPASDPLPAYDFSSYAQWVAETQDSLADADRQAIVDEYGEWPELFPFETGQVDGTTTPIVHEERLPHACFEGVTRFCTEHAIGLHDLLQTLFAVALCRWLDVPTVVMGSAVSGRDSGAAASLVGCIINTVLVRTVPQADDTVLDLLRRSTQGAHRRPAISALPLKQLLSCLIEAGCDVPSSPIDVYFALDDIPRSSHDIDGRCVRSLDHRLEPGRAALTLVAIAAGDGVRLQWKSSGRHFDANAIARLAKYYQQLVFDAVSSPKQSLLDLASPGWSHGVIPSPEPRCTIERTLIDGIAEQVARRPEACAMIAGRHHYTYASLWEKSARRASALRCAGVGPGDFVVLGLQKSPDFVELVIAAWRIGAAVCPQDETFRSDTDQQWCVDNGVRLIVRERGSVPDRHMARSVSLDELDALAPAAERPLPDQPAAQLDALAYRIYTSGSTGEPKGVDVSHRNLANFAHGFRRQAAALGLGGLTTWLWHHAFSFDASMKGYAALAEGATVVMPTAFESKSPEALVAHVLAHAIDVVNFIPSQLRFVLPLLREHGLRVHVIASGDRIDPTLEDELLAYCDWAGTQALNAYGPTETTVNATFGRLERGRRASIGTPMVNLCAWVVGRWGVPQPRGAMGELWIGGASVATGYTNRHALTAEKFPVIDTDVAPMRCYRTGDVVRLDAHDDIVFLGRVDRQAKVRGYRIELAGVEAVARKVAGVEDCAAFCDDDAVRLAVVPRPGCAVTSALQVRLLRELPAYMQPSQIHVVEAIPYTHSGKLDGRRLRALCAKAPGTERDWLTSLFGLPSLDLDKSFAENGGHSMKALSLQAEIRRRFGHRISLDALLADVPLGELVAQWGLTSDGIRESTHSQSLEPLPAEDVRPASAEEEAMWLAHQADVTGVAYNMPIWLRIEESVPVERWRDAYRRILGMHRALCSYYVLEDGRLMVRHGDPQALPLALQVLHVASTTSPGMADVLESIGRPFDLGTPCLHRMAVVRHEDGSTSLLFNLHHILVDGTSVAILVRDLFATPEPDAVPATRIGEHGMQDDRLAPDADDLHFWREYFSSCAGTRLPRRSTASSVTTVETAVVLAHDEALAFQDACRSQGVSPFQWLMSLLAVHLGFSLGQKDIVLMSPLELRAAGMDHVVGLHSRTLAYRTRWGDDETFAALLSRQRRQILSAWSHGSPSVHELRRHLAGELPPALSEAGFTWHEARDLADAWNGLSVSSRPLPLQGLKYPLWLHARSIEAGLRFELESNSDVYDSRGAHRFLQMFVQALRRTIASPDIRIDNLDAASEHVSRANAAVTFDFDF